MLFLFSDVSDDDDLEMPAFNSTPKPGQSGIVQHMVP